MTEANELARRFCQRMATSSGKAAASIDDASAGAYLLVHRL
jgi:hypothetical protein